MMKKYFAMTIIAASVALAACSDDDDDDGTDIPDEVVTSEGTAYDLIAATGNHGTLIELLDGAGLNATLDAAGSVVTVFAPDNAAFTDYEAAVDAGVATTEDDTDDLTAIADFTDAQIARILSNHVVSGSFATLADGDVLNTLAGADDTVDPALVAQTLTASIDSVDGSTSVTADGGAAAAVDSTLTGDEADVIETEQDIVHSVGAILFPSDLPADDEVIGGGDGDGDTGTFATLVGSDYSIAVQALDTAFGPGAFDNAAWTLFLPSDTVLAAEDPEITAMTAEQINGHLHTTPLDEAALAAVIAENGGTGTILSANNNGANNPASIAITDNAGATEVGGFSVTYIGVVPAGADTTGGAQVYSIDGVLPAVE